jgi:hypothetical protein
MGGAVFNDAGTVTLTGSTLTNNQTAGSGANSGGAIFNLGTLALTAVVVAGNASPLGVGGGISNVGTLNITASTIANNTAGSAAGGLFLTGSTPGTILDSTITNNSSPDGGGIAAFSGQFTLVNDTIAFNTISTTSGIGGGIAIEGATIQIGNTIVAQNTATLAGPDIDGTVTSQGTNLIGNPSGATGLVGSDLQNVNPLLGPLQNNGGPTPTLALLPGSPAFNAGNTSLATGAGLTTDQRGFLRVVGPRVDIGAFEFQPAATTVTVLSSLNPSLAGQAVTFTASVTPTAPGPNNVPTGTVFFSSNGALGSASLVNGVATFSTAALPVGNDAIVATYGGDFNFTANSGGRVQTVQGQTTTALASSANPSAFGQAITFTATVSPVAPAAGSPSGMVSFSSDGTALGSVGLVNGVASLSTAALAVGSHAIAASYAGDGIFLASSGGLTQQVNQGATATTLASSADPSTFGLPVTFPARVSRVAPAAG